MPNDLERPLRRMKSLRLVLDALEDRRLLSGAGVQDDDLDEPPAASSAWVASPQSESDSESEDGTDPLSEGNSAPVTNATESDTPDTPTGTTPVSTTEDSVPVSGSTNPTTTSPAPAMTSTPASVDEVETSTDFESTFPSNSTNQAPVASGSAAAEDLDDEAEPGAATTSTATDAGKSVTSAVPGASNNGRVVAGVTAARVPTQTDSEAESDEAEAAPPAGRDTTALTTGKAEAVVGSTEALSAAGLVARTSEAPAEPAMARLESGAEPMGSPGLSESGLAGEEPSPASRVADLLAGFSPFDRATLEQAIDQFLDRLGELELGLAQWSSRENLVPNLLTAAVVVSAAELVRRRLRDKEHDEDAAADDGPAPCPLGMPGLPLGWALEE